jgi:hypothetical protein
MLNEKTAARLASLLNMLSSDQDGERQNAVRAIARLVKDEAIDWHIFIPEAVLRGVPHNGSARQEEASPPRSSAWTDAFADIFAASPFARQPQPDPEEPGERAPAEDALAFRRRQQRRETETRELNTRPTSTLVAVLVTVDSRAYNSARGRRGTLAHVRLTPEDWDEHLVLTAFDEVATRLEKLRPGSTLILSTTPPRNPKYGPVITDFSVAPVRTAA